MTSPMQSAAAKTRQAVRSDSPPYRCWNIPRQGLLRRRFALTVSWTALRWTVARWAVVRWAAALSDLLNIFLGMEL